MIFEDYKECGTIERVILSDDTAGGTVGTWEVVKDIYGKFETIDGNFGLELNRLLGSSPSRFKTWYTDDIITIGSVQNTERLIIRGKTFNIHSVVNVDLLNEHVEMIIYESKG